MAYGPKNDGGELLRLARELHRAGRNYNQIAKELGVSPVTTHRWLDPVYAATRRTQINVGRRLRAQREG